MAPPTLILLAVVGLPVQAISQDAIPTIQGTGTATRGGAGNFSATLPDGSVCTATFSGGKISLFGRSAARSTTATCRNGETIKTARTIVSRRLNGSPEEAMLTFNDGTKIRVLFPRADKPTPSLPSAASESVAPPEAVMPPEPLAEPEPFESPL